MIPRGVELSERGALFHGSVREGWCWFWWWRPTPWAPGPWGCAPCRWRPCRVCGDVATLHCHWEHRLWCRDQYGRRAVAR